MLFADFGFDKSTIEEMTGWTRREVDEMIVKSGSERFSGAFHELYGARDLEPILKRLGHPVDPPLGWPTGDLSVERSDFRAARGQSPSWRARR